MAIRFLRRRDLADNVYLSNRISWSCWSRSVPLCVVKYKRRSINRVAVWPPAESSMRPLQACMNRDRFAGALHHLVPPPEATPHCRAPAARRQLFTGGDFFWAGHIESIGSYSVHSWLTGGVLNLEHLSEGFDHSDGWLVVRVLCLVSYDDGHRFVTVHILVNFIVLPHWETRPLAP